MYRFIYPTTAPTQAAMFNATATVSGRDNDQRCQPANQWQDQQQDWETNQPRDSPGAQPQVNNSSTPTDAPQRTDEGNDARHEDGQEKRHHN